MPNHGPSQRPRGGVLCSRTTTTVPFAGTLAPLSRRLPPASSACQDARPSRRPATAPAVRSRSQPMSIRPSLPLAGLLLAVSCRSPPPSRAPPKAPRSAVAPPSRPPSRRSWKRHARSPARPGGRQEKSPLRGQGHAPGSRPAEGGQAKVIDSEREVSETRKGCAQGPWARGDPEKIEKRKSQAGRGPAPNGQAKKAWNRPGTMGHQVPPTPRASRKAYDARRYPPSAPQRDTRCRQRCLPQRQMSASAHSPYPHAFRQGV